MNVNQEQVLNNNTENTVTISNSVFTISKSIYNSLLLFSNLYFQNKVYLDEESSSDSFCHSCNDIIDDTNESSKFICTTCLSRHKV